MRRDRMRAIFAALGAICCRFDFCTRVLLALGLESWLRNKAYWSMKAREERADNSEARGAATTGGADKPQERYDDPSDAQDEAAAALGWRVKLLRALITGDLKLTQQILLEHVDMLSAPFTREMPAWTLQYEALHWWMLQNASALFTASCYSQPRIVEWLLRRGADREAASYLKQTALQVVGECCEHAPTLNAGDVTDRRRLAAASAECRRLLKAPASLPSAPSASSVVFLSEYATEIVHVAAPSSSAAPSSRLATANGTGRVGSDGTGMASPPSRSSNSRASNGARYVKQKVYSCLATITWDTPDSNGAIIDKYELRYRAAVAPRTTASGRAENPQSKSSDAETDGGWCMERSTHNRKVRTQRMVLGGCLQFNTLYECALRSWNSAGKGEWGEIFTAQTGASPE